MNTINTPKLKTIAQNLRRRMTREECHLWFDFLRLLPVTFHRQKVIGPYIVDFCCASEKLIVELDGAQHYLEDGKKRDKERDAYLSKYGFRVLRYSNVDVNLNFHGICEDILRHLPKSVCRSESSP